MCDLHKTKVSKSKHYQFKINRVCNISWIVFRVVMSFVLMFVSFTVNMQYLKLLLFSCFKILCWQCWKTAAVHQRMIMLDEWDEDNELPPSPLVPLTTVFVELLPECCTEENEEEPPVPRRPVDEQIQIWAPLPNNLSRKEGRLVSER